MIDVGRPRFGDAVSVGPDVDGDGHPDVAIGEPPAQQTNEIGAVHLYSGATGALLRSIGGGQAGDLFGARVVLGADVDGDGAGDVLVTSQARDAWSGHVQLFSGATGDELASWQGEASAGLGRSIDMGPDVDGDGVADLVMADDARYDEWVEGGDILHSKRGRVFVYSGRDPRGAPLLVLEAPIDDSPFGEVAQLGPDADGDGRGDILVRDGGAGQGGGGLVHLYSGASGALLHTWGLGGPTYYFGTSAVLGPDADGDGLGDVAIAMRDPDQTEHVVLYAGATDTVLQTWTSDNWHVLYPGHLDMPGDLDGDGHGDVLIGADMALAEANQPAMETFAQSGATGALLASWSHAEQRYFRTTSVSASADGEGCGALIGIGVVEGSEFDGPVPGRVELRRLP